MNSPDARYSQITCRTCKAAPGQVCTKVRGPRTGQKADFPHWARLSDTHSFHAEPVR